MIKPTILTVCGDPGGAKTILPLLKLLLKEDKVNLVNYAYNQASEILTDHNVRSNAINVINEEAIKTYLTKNKITLVMTATSCNDKEWEKPFISFARELGIYTIAVLDFWSNYARRFSNVEGKLTYIPHKIIVMDKRAKVEAIAEKIPHNIIKIFGQPIFDQFVQCSKKFSTQQKIIFKDKLNIQQNDLLITFVSQPIYKFCGGHDSGDYPGYDERIVLHNIIDALEKISEKYKKNITLIIKPHPRETCAEYYCYSSKKISIIVSNIQQTSELLMSSDLVLGMTSMLLMEACFLNCIVLSLQPNLQAHDPLPTNRSGESIGVFMQNQIEPFIEKFLFDKTARNLITQRTKALRKKQYATRRIVNFIYSVLGEIKNVKCI